MPYGPKRREIVDEEKTRAQSVYSLTKERVHGKSRLLVQRRAVEQERDELFLGKERRLEQPEKEVAGSIPSVHVIESIDARAREAEAGERN